MTTADHEDEQSSNSQHSGVSNKLRTHHHHVEIATLTMPAAATTSEAESGDGSTFVLEAPSHVIEQFVSEQPQYDNYGASEISHSTSKPKNPHIEGVVDLELVSHLVSGVTEEEFVDLLQQDGAYSQVYHDVYETTDQHQHDHSQQPRKEGDGESQPLLKQQLNDDTACLVVSADPFEHVSAEFHEESVVEYGLSSVKELGSAYKEAEEENDDNMSVVREAYLLSVPTNSAGGDPASGSYYSGEGIGSSGKTIENIFVLALPEVMATMKEDEAFEDVMGSTRTSHVTNTTVHNTMEELQHRLEHAFAPLPTDVRHIELRVSTAITTEGVALGHRPGEEIHLDVVVDRKVPPIGYIILVTGLFALSSVGVAFDLQQGGVTPEMKAFWRFTSTALLFSVLASKSLNKEELGKFTWKEFWVWMPFAGVNYGFMCTAFVVALEMTSLVNAFILSNLASLIIIGSKFAMGLPVLFWEGVGAAIGMAGALLCASAGYDAKEADNFDSKIAMLGNILAFLASVSTALYLSVAKTLRARVDLFVFMLLIFTYASATVLAYMTFVGQPYEFSFDPVIGLFGWVDMLMDRLPLELWMAIICNGLGTTGYIAIMKYFDPVVVSMVMLMEPILASLMGAAVGVSALPGLVTWAGDAVVVLGSILVIWSGSKKTETIDASGALHAVNEELLVEGKPDLLRRSSMSTKTSYLKRTISLKSPRLLRSPMIQTTRKDRSISEDTTEFVFVGNKARNVVSSTGLGGSRHKMAWN
ncbi:hypothetical protein HJC23_000714 [Cyclotella cryptica]|uniref:EamA domain-containing protein n=1 Tax=Cyclotella cryptica TaxID=29204 RepID=A0ABD3QAP7_9STRA|eukprot:CCRYP_007434-RB/>CCRYP_007434-RB protein AED:0.03 eAED:0.03 QI:1932/1/1/1/1/0.66/3/2086/756